MRRAALITLLVASCGGGGHKVKMPPPVDPGGGGTTGPLHAKLPSTVERVVVSQTRPSGTSVTTVNVDGSISVSIDVVENGRGPHTDATVKLGADGTIASLQATGHHEMGTPVDEKFERTGDHAVWKSNEEQGEADVSGAAFYLPMSTLPDVDGWLVQAAVANGGTLPLLPGGTITVEKGPELDIGDRTVVVYTISGAYLNPDNVWMNADGSWFGYASEWWSVVPKGTEAAIPKLIAAQKELQRAREAEFAKAQAHAPPAAGLAYTHARVLDVDKGKWLKDQTVVVVGDTITAVGPGKKVKVPAGAEVVDLAGKALIPGMVDMHAHLGDVAGDLNIASGVTSVRDVGNDPDLLDDLHDRFDAGTAIGPHVYRFGFIEGRGPKAASSKVTAETEEEALAGVKFYVDRGYDGIKIYNSMKPELVPVITKAAHDAGKKVTGHIPVHMLAEEAVKAGYDGIEHINMLFLNFLATHETDTRDTTRFTLVGEKGADLDLKSKEVKAFVKLLKEHKTVIDPTLDAFEDLLVGEPGKIIPGLEDTVARLPLQAQRGWLVNGLPTEDPAQYKKSYQRCLDMVKLLYQSKVTLVLGTDALPGLMFHHEMALFARAGIPNAAVLKIATIGAAQVLGHADEFGSITVGKRADLVVVDGDPLKTISDIGKVVSTMRSGVVYQSAPLYAEHGVTAR